MSKKRPHSDPTDDPRSAEAIPSLRIIGGTWRHRKLEYSGDPRTRPMKDRVREAVFNLVGPDIKGMHAIDLFAGTGALALEALSRGAAVATCIEQHFPTADVIRKNAKTLEATERITIIPGNTFIWSRRRGDLGEKPWAVFCSPPYAFWVERQAEMLNLLNTLLAAAPNGSIFVVEADEQFDMANLPIAEEWDVRVYPPAFVAIRKLAK